MGFWWFLTFKIRIMKVALSILRHNPVRALITANVFAEVGSPVGDNLITVTAQKRIGYALGWDMLFGAPGLNPWVNMMEW